MLTKTPIISLRGSLSGFKIKIDPNLNQLSRMHQVSHNATFIMSPELAGIICTRLTKAIQWQKHPLKQWANNRTKASK